MNDSPLFWPVTYRDCSIFVLDETELPWKETYLRADTLDQVLSIITGMKTRAFGQVAIVYYLFLMLADTHQTGTPRALLSVYKDAAEKVNQSRPTIPFPFFTGMILKWANEAIERNDTVFESIRLRISGFLTHLRQKRLEQAHALSRLLIDGDCVLTHCNVSGALTAAAEGCRSENKTVHFFVTETRPYLQGARLTAYELHRAGFDVTVLPDSAAAYVMQKKMVTKLVTGADQMAQNGDIANKIGTLQLALTAQRFELPFYVLAPPPSNAKTGNDICVEMRPEDELLVFGGKRIAPEGVKGFYPAFDITPRELITRHIPLELS